MKICAYVQEGYDKRSYKDKSFDYRMWAGLMVIVDSLERSGYSVEYAGLDTVHLYDIVLVSMTSDFDWWAFISERIRWQSGSYLTVIGGQGVLNVRPLLPYADCFVLGRGENLILDIVQAHAQGNRVQDESVIYSDAFNMDSIYRLRQECPYPHEIMLSTGKAYKEVSMGCPHKCRFCTYSHSRKYSGNGAFLLNNMRTGLWDEEEGSGVINESALLDMVHSGNYDLPHLRVTAIDGMSERIRKIANKPIKRDHLQELFSQMAVHEKPHNIKLYNMVGYPSETEADWREFLEDLTIVDSKHSSQEKRWYIQLHTTPFRAMSVTPAACWPMSYRNYRGVIADTLRTDAYKGTIFYKGNRFVAIEGPGTGSLQLQFLAAIIWRGTELDNENIERLSVTKKFWGASAFQKQKTLEHYFDAPTLFGAFTFETLPTRNIRTYLPIEKHWDEKPWEQAGE